VYCYPKVSGRGNSILVTMTLLMAGGGRLFFRGCCRNGQRQGDGFLYGWPNCEWGYIDAVGIAGATKSSAEVPYKVGSTAATGGSAGVERSHRMAGPPPPRYFEGRRRDGDYRGTETMLREPQELLGLELFVELCRGFL